MSTILKMVKDEGQVVNNCEVSSIFVTLKVISLLPLNLPTVAKAEESKTHFSGNSILNPSSITYVVAIFHLLCGRILLLLPLPLSPSLTN